VDVNRWPGADQVVMVAGVLGRSGCMAARLSGGAEGAAEVSWLQMVARLRRVVGRGHATGAPGNAAEWPVVTAVLARTGRSVSGQRQPGRERGHIWLIGKGAGAIRDPLGALLSEPGKGFDASGPRVRSSCDGSRSVRK
jgi:hypothetical protein